MNIPQGQGVTAVDPLSFDNFKPTRTGDGVITEDANAVADGPKTDAAGGVPDANIPELSDEEIQLAGGEEVDDAKPVWSDEFKKSLKDLTGFDDPEKFKSEYAASQERYRLDADELKPLRDLKQRLDKLSPNFLKALNAEMAKSGEGHRLLREGPDPDVLSKDPRKLTDRQVLEYVDNHGITDNDWAALNDPEADPGVQDAIRKRIGFLRQNGEDIIRGLQNSAKAEMEAESNARIAAHERFTKGVADAIATAKAGPLKSFVTPALENEIRSGQFINRFFQDDGVTPTAKLLETIIKAEKYDSAKEAARKYGEKKGYERGLAEATSGLPSAPRATRTAPAPKTTGGNPWAKALDNIEAQII